MPSPAYRGEREDDGWIRPYDPHRDVGDWSRRPHASSGQQNYGFEREREPRYDQYYNRPYHISNNGDSRLQRNPSGNSSSSRHVPIPKSERRRCIYWALTIFSTLALLLLVSLTVFLVLYVLDLERNNSATSTTAPTQLPEVTTRAPAAVTVNIGMKLLKPFLTAYSDPGSAEYMQLDDSVTTSMRILFLASDLSESFIGANVNSFKSGSIDVNVTLSFTNAILFLTPTADPNDSGASKESLIGVKVVVTITSAVDSGTCCQELQINSATVQATQVTIHITLTSAPTVRPSTSTPRPPVTMPATVAATQMPEPAATTKIAAGARTTLPPGPGTTMAKVPAKTTKTVVVTPMATTPAIVETTRAEVVTTAASTEEPTTVKTSILNPPECGMSTQAPPTVPLTSRGVWPWVGSLRLRTGHTCGATLLGREWAVTSASCLGRGGTFTSLVFGDITSSYSQSDVHVEQAIARVHPHPGFNLVTYDNDITFIRMTGAVEYSEGVGPVCLQQANQAGGGDVQTYGNCYIAGWSTSSDSAQDDLRTASASIISEGPCQESGLLLDLTDKFICAQFPNTDACISDLGGGLMCQNNMTGVWSLVGLIDFISDDCSVVNFLKISSYWDIASSIVDGDATIPCDPIQVPQCTSALPYSSTYLTTQSAVTDLMSSAQSSGLLNCHIYASAVLCAAVMPECRSNGTGLTLCRQTCEDVSSDCENLFNQLSVELDCRVYPMGVADSSGLCQSGEDYSCGNQNLLLLAAFDHDIISSPNHPMTYPGYDDCVWIITAPKNSHVIIKFLSLETESCCDTLTIGEGSDVEDRTTIHEVVYSDSPPLPVVIPNSVAWIRFQSDRDINRAGFQAEVQAVGNTGLASICSEPSTYRCSDGVSCIPYRWRCDGIYDCVIRDDESCRVIYQEFMLGINGYQQIASPGYATVGYVSSATYTYVVVTDSGGKLLVDWYGFSTEEGFDFLEVGDGRDPDDKTTRFFSWDGAVLPPLLLSSANEMWIEFKSDRLINGIGFDMDVVAVPGSESLDCTSNQFDCGHSVCIPSSWQCNTAVDCVDGVDEAGCVSLTALGFMTLLAPFTTELENKTSTEYLDLSEKFISAMDAALGSGLGAEYIYTATQINSFRSSDDPALRAANTPVTVVDFTIELINLPPANPTNVTQQIIMDALTSEVSDGSFGVLSVNASSLQIYEVPDGSATTESPTAGQPACSDGEFECNDGQCISASSVCDQEVNCGDGSDEEVGPLCRVACGSQSIVVPAEGSVSLTAPTFLPNLGAGVEQSCGYIVVAPANHRVYVALHKVNLLPDNQQLVLTFGEGEMLSYKAAVDQPLDVVSPSQSIQIALFRSMWTNNYGVVLEFWATNETDISVCDNGLQVLPAARRCDQSLDCHDYSDEISCQSTCGQSSYTLAYNVSVLLQLTNYPVNYANNTACLWLVTGLANASIIFQLDAVGLVNGDALTFGQGHDHTASMTTVTEVPGILPTGSRILVPGSQAWVLFLTDSENTDTGFSVSMRVLYDGDFIRCNNLVQVVFQEELCDGTAQCEGDPTDETNCDACLNIPVASCASILSYSKTTFPNKYASDASSAIAQYQQAQASFCQAQTELVICSLLFPECPVAGSSRRAVCRSACEAAIGGCNFNDGICDSSPQTGGGLWCNYDGDILETGICGTRPLAPNPFSRIVNGQDASDGEWPWMLAILDSDYDFQCGATLISNQWAITAAHCADVVDSILAGFINLGSLGPHFKLVSITEIITHPFYDSGNEHNFDNDIALLKLETPLEFNDRIRPACLNTAQIETEIYQNCHATGWGALREGGSLPDILQEVQLPLVPLANCSEALSHEFAITENMICAGYEDGRSDACQGDSGGPLVCETQDGRWVLVGATSFGLGCARPGLPGAYVRISQYMDFIEFHIKESPSTDKVIG